MRGFLLFIGLCACSISAFGADQGRACTSLLMNGGSWVSVEADRNGNFDARLWPDAYQDAERGRISYETKRSGWVGSYVVILVQTGYRGPHMAVGRVQKAIIGFEAVGPFGFDTLVGLLVETPAGVERVILSQTKKILEQDKSLKYLIKPANSGVY